MKHIRLLSLCTSAAVVLLCLAAGQRCFGQAPQRAPRSNAASSVDAPAMRRTSHFFLVSEDGSATSATLGAALDAIHDRLSQAMTSYGLPLETARDPLLWICFDDREQYRRYSTEVERANPAFQDAFYSTRSNHVVLYSGSLTEDRSAVERAALPGPALHLTSMGSGSASQRSVPRGISADRVEVLTHEMAHQLAYNSGLQKRGVMYPLWVSEGLATYFEECALPGGRGRQRRRQRLAALGADGRLLPLGRLAVLTGAEALEPSAADAYAQFWGLLGFLLECRPNELRNYLAELSSLPQGRRSSIELRSEFVRHFGPIEPLERQWRFFVAALPPASAGRDRSVASSGF